MAEKIGEIREKFKSCRQEELGGLIACYREDSRAGVRSLQLGYEVVERASTGGPEYETI